MASCGDIVPRWKRSENMIRAVRCIRQNSIPTRSSGDRGKPWSHSSISQYNAQPSPQNGVLNAARCVMYRSLMKPCR